MTMRAARGGPSPNRHGRRNACLNAIHAAEAWLKAEEEDAPSAARRAEEAVAASLRFCEVLRGVPLHPAPVRPPAPAPVRAPVRPPVRAPVPASSRKCWPRGLCELDRAAERAAERRLDPASAYAVGSHPTA